MWKIFTFTYSFIGHFSLQTFLLLKADIEETSTSALFLKTRVDVVYLLSAQCNCKKALCSLHSSNLCQ